MTQFFKRLFFCKTNLIFFVFQYLCTKAEQNLFSRSSSTSGTDSSIRIRKTRAGCTERRWFISVSLAMIFTVLVASAGIYFGCKYYHYIWKVFPLQKDLMNCNYFCSVGQTEKCWFEAKIVNVRFNISTYLQLANASNFHHFCKMHMWW